MSIEATVTSEPIVATVSGSTSGDSVVASVTVDSVSVGVYGGIGPTGLSGAAASAISAMSDVQLDTLSDGDVLRYSSGKWRNYADSQITDGGNF